ncbi:MarR family winged helix-turn-helix transcriptional regulator [Paucilactobacillus wasatchensis]|uniref:MarR family winged helix-turn-helix transcriptional regulator n=1 Tax=Paucilactobacillus wasatchensis TaxID=1335616 RepID=UPI001CDA7CB3|nr:MarR family transcriptional regulator [Paucilactobacillus wasatchensis]
MPTYNRCPEGKTGLTLTAEKHLMDKSTILKSLIANKEFVGGTMELFEFSKYIAAVYRQSKNDFKQQITELDVRATQSDLVMFIRDHPGLTQQQIASNMTIDASLLAKDVKLLINKGWVQRKIDPADRRARVITLTEAGQALARQLQATMSDWWADLFLSNPEIDSAILGHQLELVRKALEARKVD